MSRWLEVKAKDFSQLPRKPGVYCIYVDSSWPTYIGSSRNLRQRVREHFRGSIWSKNFRSKWCKFEWCFIKYRVEREIGEGAMAEVKLIKKLNPQDNRKPV